MRNIGKGSITIWLSLVMCVILSLILVCIQSARTSAARAFLSICFDQSLFSEFARYDRILYEKYGLLAVDAGFGGGDIDFSTVAAEINDAAEELISVNEDLFRCSLEETDITGYVLATDSGAAALRSQICDLMTVKLGADGVNRLLGMVEDNLPVVREQEEKGTENPEATKEAYEQQKAEAAARQAEREAQEALEQETDGDPDGEEPGGSGSEEPEGLVEVPADFRNPLDNYEAIMRMGIYNIILPDPTNLSTRSIDRNTLAENRPFQNGMGNFPPDESNAAEHLLMAAYIRDFFPNFLSSSQEEGLQYQAEFAIAGGGSDAENLKSVLNRLLLIRMGLNYIYLLLFSPDKQAEATGVALIIASIFLNPELTEVIAQILLIAWAYCEAMMDLKTLLAGGREPLIKDETTWQLSLEQMAFFSAGTQVDTSRRGLSYEDYLILLLCMVPDSDLTKRTLDLLEYNRRIIGNDPSFQIDSCITAMEIEAFGMIDNAQYSIRRCFSYSKRSA